MFGGKSKASPIDSLIGSGSSILGDVTFSGGLRIDGGVRGNIYSAGEKPSTLVLSEHAKVEGEIHVAHIVINGEVVGPVHASEYVELMPKARVTGDVHYKQIEIHVGAVVSGKLVHVGDGKEQKVLEFKPSVTG